MAYTLKAALIGSAMAIASVAAMPAQAVVLSFTNGTTVQSGTFGRGSIPGKANTGTPFSDTLSFTLGTAGLFSASLTSSTTVLKGKGDLDFTSFTLTGPNSFSASIPVSNVGFKSGADLAAPLSLAAGAYTLTVVGTSYGTAQYSGETTFTAAVPEAATWLMMVGGFGAMGLVTRRRRPALVNA